MRRGALRIVVGFLVAAALYPGSAHADECEAYWLRLYGKDEQQVLRLPNELPFAQFTNNEPSWDPDVFDAGGRRVGPAPPSALLWVAVEKPPRLQLVGRMGGRRVYSVRYSEGL